jgi:hypothetical protein
LRLPELPEPGELPDRIVVPVDAQVGDWPRLRLGDEHPGRAHGGDLAAGGQTGLERGDEPAAEIVPGPAGEGREHRRGHPGVGQQVAGRGRTRRVHVRCHAQRPLAGVARRAADRVDNHELPERDVRGALGEPREGVARGHAAGDRVQQLPAQPGIGRALAAHGPDAGLDGGAPRRDRHARRGDDGADRARALAAAYQRERHGLTATTVTSTSHSGRASAATTSPVNTG